LEIVEDFWLYLEESEIQCAVEEATKRNLSLELTELSTKQEILMKEALYFFLYS